MGTAGTPPPLGGGLADLLKEAPPHVGYHVKFGNAATKGVCTNRKEPKKLGCAWALLPYRRGVADPLEIRPFQTSVILPNLVVLALLGRSA